VSRYGWWLGPSTVDGLSGSGKSTVARIMADNVIPVLEVGEVYRYVDRQMAASASTPIVSQQREWASSGVGTNFQPATEADVELERLLVVTQDPRIRDVVTQYQVYWTSLYSQSIVVGRVGGHIFPTAEVRVFLSVNSEEQILRLGAERARKARIRDEADRCREHDPAVPAKGAVQIDTSGRTPQEVVSIIDDVIRRRWPQWRS
jgi:cytidylate kinase